MGTALARRERRAVDASFHRHREVAREDAIARLALYAVLIVPLSLLGYILHYDSSTETVATCWPPSGLLLAMLVLTPVRWWVVFIVATFVGSLATDRIIDTWPTLFDSAVPGWPDDGVVRIEWHEQLASPAAPAQLGTGLQLARALVEHDLEGRFSWSAEGKSVRCQIVLSLTRTIREAARPARA